MRHLFLLKSSHSKTRNTLYCPLKVHTFKREEHSFYQTNFTKENAHRKREHFEGLIPLPRIQSPEGSFLQTWSQQQFASGFGTSPSQSIGIHPQRRTALEPRFLHRNLLPVVNDYHLSASYSQFKRQRTQREQVFFPTLLDDR